MKTKILVAVLTIGLITMSTVQAQEKAKMNQVQTEKAAYACPMQCEGEKTYDKPGSCPKCKMDLKKMEMKTASKKMKMDQSKMKQGQMEKATYSCPMHADMKSDKPGACPKCGMALKNMEMKKDSATMNMGQCNMEMGQACACPMHAAIKNDKPCACPKCEMDPKKMEMKKDSATMNMDQCNMEMGQACACPMHAAAKSDKTCTCPKCGMELKEKKTEMKKVE